MKKVLSILFVFVIILNLVGCNSKPPEGISQEFWDESKEVVKLLKKELTHGKLQKNDEAVVIKYYDPAKKRILKEGITEEEVELYTIIEEIYIQSYDYDKYYNDPENILFQSAKEEMELRFKKLEDDYGL